jgi:hypothetical protein
LVVALLAFAAPTDRGAGTFIGQRQLNAIVVPVGGTPLGADASRAQGANRTIVAALTAPAEQARVPPSDLPPPEQPLRPAVLGVDFPDPALVWGGDRWYAFATSGPAGNVQAVSSPDLLSWSTPTDAVPVLGPDEVGGATWAPMVTKLGDHWLLVVAVGHTAGQHCIDGFTSATPGGPYTPIDGPSYVCADTGGSGAIDPFVAVAPDGKAYLYWKAEGGSARQIFGAPLTADGNALAAAPVHLLAATAGWEQGGIENPSMVLADGSWYLLFSGAYWASSAYAMGWAHCDGPLGPCHADGASAPWLVSRGPVVGPGGGSVSGPGPDGRLWLAYHSWAGGPGYSGGGRRVLHVEPLTFAGGRPALADAPPTGALAGATLTPAGLVLGGHAIDPDWAGPIGVTVRVNGFAVGHVMADVAGHAFDYALALADGAHHVCADAVDDVLQDDPEIGCVDIDVSWTPTGGVHRAADGSIVGWAIDPSTAAPIAVELRVAGAYAGTVLAGDATSLPATWAAWGSGHGFVATVPTAGPVCVYAIPSGSAPAVALGCA